MGSSHTDTDLLVLEAEDNLLEHGTWDQAPQEVQEKAEELLDQGLPVGIAHHPRKGWMVLMLIGGKWSPPNIAWQQPEPPNARRR